MRDFNRAIIILALVIVFTGIILPENYFVDPIRTATKRVSRPIEALMSSMSLNTRSSFNNLFSLRSIYDNNTKLEKENAKLISENVQLLELKSENELLRDLLRFQKANQDYNLVPARIISKDPDSFLQSMTVDVGTEQGVAVGQGVILNGYIVGKVDRVYTSHARVLLLTNRSSVVNAQIVSSRANGLIKGELGYGLVIDSLPQDANVKLNDRVISSGLGGNIPKGLIIGTISEIVSDESDVFQKASVSSPIDFAGLELVFIITDF
jgi:rod shape-determining protein MreC